MLVTLEQAKLHLRYDDNSNDAYINGLIASADAAIKKHVDVYDADNAAMKHAALLLIGYWDTERNCGKVEQDAVLDFFLPRPVLALLTPYRTPVGV